MGCQCVNPLLQNRPFSSQLTPVKFSGASISPTSSSRMVSLRPAGARKLVFTASAADPSASRPTPLINADSSVGFKGCKLVGCGSALPSLSISNDDLAKLVDTNDEWISVRTGIRNRRVLSGKDNMTALAVEASKKALEMAEVDPGDVDLILLCTSTPEDLFGSAPQIQKALGCRSNPLSFDITAACSGFMLGLVSAACYIRGGGFKNVLVIGADALSRYVDWTDRGTCILFGDGAGAVLVQACDIAEDGLFAFDLHSDGEGQRHLNASLKENETDKKVGTNGSLIGFPPKSSNFSCIQMNGKEVFRFAVRVVPQSIEASLQKAGLTNSSIDWLLLHQANQRIIDAVATRLEIPSEHVISNLSNYGNTSAASIPLALDEAVRSGKVQAGHTIAAAGFGAGLTWGSAIMRWG
ncbi:3-oxoacyl-[acyl-carrier-protein] synthase 3 A, chloroplastic-like [Ipomoea triloba]|uniref:3-oxoacyl-[acyl-carrier-protein] synthase 3 A, chloroplastic-like n=1 Tax=Ipomoea triloba TaxID=35885 RepID=UPI00125D4791|nr:3-oxoacyl-[acyl-carrier-protein] synthase 3 A, chloroplastic-like [Ipomoea triloba]